MATVNTPSAAIPATPTMDSPSVEKQSSPMVEKLEHVPRRSRTPSTSSCSSVLFQFEIPGSKPNTKSPLDQDDDVAWMDDFLCPTAPEGDVRVRLGHPLFDCCGRALSILSDEPLTAFKKELLLDNMNILKRTTDDDDVDDDDDDDDDLLSEGDLEDDCEVDCYDEEDVLDSKLYCSSTPVVESRSPLRPETTSPSSSWNRRGSSNYQRELLLDGGFDEMARLLAKFQLDDRTEDDDDVLSEGDVESCYGDDEDDQEDDFDDGDSDYDSNGSHQNHLFVISE